MKINRDIKLKITKYSAGDGEEYFLEIVNRNNILFGLLRLRVFNGLAIIREIHVYGKALNVGDEADGLGQHSGFGKLLLSKAEEIVIGEKIKELKIISGVGVREYYKKLGYRVDRNGYMKKTFLVIFKKRLL